MKSWMNSDIIAGGIVIALSALAINGAWRFPAASSVAPGPAVFPLLIAALWMPFGGALIVNGWRQPTPATGITISVRPMAGLLALTVTYVGVMPLMGFISSSALFLTAAIRLLGYCHLWRAGALALSTAFIVFWLFAGVMNVSLPSGWVG